MPNLMQEAPSTSRDTPNHPAPFKAKEATQVYRDAFKILLRLQMTKEGISIRKLAKKSGISVSALVRYRAGDWDVPLAKVYLLAKALDCQIYDLVPSDPEMMMGG